MSIRPTAMAWLAKNFPAECEGPMRSSKYFEEQELWFLTFPTKYLIDPIPGHLMVLLQHERSPQTFHPLKVPFAFLRANRSKFDIRGGGEEFDLHISAKKSKWMMELRGEGVDFSEFCAEPGASQRQD